MEEKEIHGHDSEVGECAMCHGGAGCSGICFGMCGQHCHRHARKMVKLLIVVLVLLFVFLCGVHVGEFKGMLRSGRGYYSGGNQRHSNYGMMRAVYNNGVQQDQATTTSQQ